MSSHGSPVSLLKFQTWTLNIVWVQKERTQVYMSEWRATHSHRTWIEVSSSIPHHLHKGLQLSPIKRRCRLRLLCPVRRPVTTLDWVLLKGRILVLAVELGPEIIFRVCLCVLIYIFPFILPGGPQSRRYKCNMKPVPYGGLTAVKHYCTKVSHHGDQAPRVCASLACTHIRGVVNKFPDWWLKSQKGLP